MIEPPFIWPGNKRMHLEHILPHVPMNCNRFVDVFGGSGVVLLNTPFHEFDVFNDLNSHVVNFFRVIRKRETLDEFVKQMELHVHSREQFEEYRESRDLLLDPVERAVAWYYTIETSFSRLGRHYGRNMRASYETRRVYERLQHLEQVHLRIRHCYIENKNAFELALEHDSPDTTFYMDPPYINTQHGTYKHDDFGPKKHRDLLELIDQLKGKVILSGEPCEMYDEYDYWEFTDKWAATSRVNNGDRSQGRIECLWVKPSTGT